MKVFDISGKLYVEGNISHQEMLNIIYQLKKQGIHFAGITKDVTDKYVETEEYIRIY